MDTTWDKIYKEYQISGKTYATLNEGLHPSFVSLITTGEFKLKQALDVGCGTGKYLKFLEENNFEVTGIDSSKTAIEMSKNCLSPNSKLHLMDMYEYFPDFDAFDLVISHATLHHGKKADVVSLIRRLHDSLVEAGKFFISLPSDDAGKNWPMMTKHEKIDDGTLIPLIGPEKGLPHSFFSSDEVDNIFDCFSKHEKFMDEKDGRWIIIGEK